MAVAPDEEEPRASQRGYSWIIGPHRIRSTIDWEAVVDCTSVMVVTEMHLLLLLNC